MVNRPLSFPYKLALIHHKFVKISLVRCLQPLSLSHNFQHTFLLYCLPKIWKSNSLKFLGGVQVVERSCARRWLGKKKIRMVQLSKNKEFSWRRSALGTAQQRLFQAKQLAYLHQIQER